MRQLSEKCGLETSLKDFKESSVKWNFRILHADFDIVS